MIILHLNTLVDNSFSDEASSIKSSFEIPLENLEPTISNHSSIYSNNLVMRKLKMKLKIQ